MAEKKYPKLRTVDKSLPPFALNDFPKDFAYTLGREIVYLLATKGRPVLIGDEWEAIFAKCIGAGWKVSNVGLDDVFLGNTAWGAKTVKAPKPSEAKMVRLISGRNSTIYSFGDTVDTNNDPNEVGEHVLDIWNQRVSAIREKFQTLRTIVLIKSEDLTEVAVFEFDTIRYDPELFVWQWNKKGNLEGFEKSKKVKRFTWQPHGSQFTITEDVPEKCLVINIKKPETLDKEKILQALGFDRNWITITQRKSRINTSGQIAIEYPEDEE